MHWCFIYLVILKCPQGKKMNVLTAGLRPQPDPWNKPVHGPMSWPAPIPGVDINLLVSIEQLIEILSFTGEVWVNEVSAGRLLHCNITFDIIGLQLPSPPFIQRKIGIIANPRGCPYREKVIFCMLRKRMIYHLKHGIYGQPHWLSVIIGKHNEKA